MHAVSTDTKHGVPAGMPETKHWMKVVAKATRHIGEVPEMPSEASGGHSMICNNCNAVAVVAAAAAAAPGTQTTS